MKIFLPLFFTLLVLSLAIGFPLSYYEVQSFKGQIGSSVSYSFQPRSWIINITVCFIMACLGFIIIRSYRNVKASR